jgi:hypothetical protein
MRVLFMRLLIHLLNCSVIYLLIANSLLLLFIHQRIPLVFHLSFCYLSLFLLSDALPFV